MAEDKIKKQEAELDDEQLDEIAGGDRRGSLHQDIPGEWERYWIIPQ